MLVSMGCDYKTTPATYSFDLRFVHQSTHALVIGQNSSISQFDGNARASVSKIAGTVNSQDLLGQSVIGNGSLTGRTFNPIIVAAM